MISANTKLISILNQSASLNNTQLFFPLLHEFALYLRNHTLQESVKKIQSGEKKMIQWVEQIAPQASPEQKKLYLLQYQEISAWYALNQIVVFFERYDLGFHDNLIHELTQNNQDTNQLTYEHTELMKYAITGICPKIFPTIAEYKFYMRRIIDALNDLEVNTSVMTIYPFTFDQQANALLIEGFRIIKFTRNTNVSLLLNFLNENMWKNTTWTKVEERLGLDRDIIKRSMRQINDRIPAALPAFLIAQAHPSKLSEKIISVSGFYKKT